MKTSSLWRRRMAVAVLLVTLAVATAGCWDTEELDKRAIVLAVAIDQPQQPSERHFLFSFLIARPSQAGGADSAAGGAGAQQAPYVLYTTEANSFLDAVVMLTEKLGRTVFFGHLRVFVISEDVATNDWALLLDELVRDPDVSLLSQLVIAKGIQARDILVAPTPLSQTFSAFIIGLTEKGDIPPVANITALWEFYRDTITPGREAGVMGITLDAGQLRVEGSGMFTNGRLVGWLSDAETVGFNVVNNDLRGATIVAGNQADPWVLRDVDAVTDIKSEIRAGRLKVTISVNAEGDLGRVPKSEKEVELLKQSEQAGLVLQSKLKELIGAAMARMQIFGSDIADIGRQVRFQRPTAWRQNEWDEKWPSAFREVEIDVEVIARIRRKGLLR